LSGWRRPDASGEGWPPAPGRWHRLPCGLGYAAAVAAPVTGLALLVRVDAVRTLDERLIASATAVTRADPVLRRVLVVWQEAFQPAWVYLAGTATAAWLWRRHGLKRRAVWGFTTMMLAWNVALDVKYVVRRVRPVVAEAVSHAPGYSFPSGHAANVATVGTVVPVMVWPLLRGRPARTAVVLGAVGVIAVTAIDRVLLGVHFPTDVAAGVLLGSGLALASYAGYRGWHPVHRDASWRPRHTRKEA
jgi:membrane-associated phospholipid phosphatase